MEEALRLARESHPTTKHSQLYYYFYKCGLKGRWPARCKLGGQRLRPQEYRRVEVLELLKGWTPPAPRHQNIYRTTVRPGEGWMTVADIARITGAKKSRITSACSSHTLPARSYGKQLWTRYEEASEWLAWRRPSFVLRHMSAEWIAERRAYQKKHGLTPPPSLNNPLFGAVYAPELIHL
jgi:hypothetical protein